MPWTEESGGGFSLVEHPIPPKTLFAPLHKHSREDEYSFVIEGRMGALLGDDVVYAEAGDLAFKPRDQWHTFWNAGEAPCRILELICPGGFEHSSTSSGTSCPGPFPPPSCWCRARRTAWSSGRSVAPLCEEHGLDLSGERDNVESEWHAFVTLRVPSAPNPELRFPCGARADYMDR